MFAQGVHGNHPQSSGIIPLMVGPSKNSQSLPEKVDLTGPTIWGKDTVLAWLELCKTRELVQNLAPHKLSDCKELIGGH